MAASQSARRPAARNPIQFFSDAGNRVDQFRRQAEAAGRVIYEASIKAGKPIVANTTAQLVELGAKAIRKEVATAHAIATVAKNPRSPEAQKILHEAGAQVMAGIHGAGDAITLGAADHVSSGVRAVFDSGGDLHRVRDLYDRNIAQERQQDAFEGEHYGKARMVGEIGGTVASMLIPVGEVAQVARLAGGARALAAARLSGVGARLAPVGARAMEVAQPAVKLVDRYLGQVPRKVRVGGKLVDATAMKLREQAALAGAGAGSNILVQAIGDATSGRRSTLKDYAVAAGVGAVQGGLAHRYGPRSLGAVGGAATSIGQDYFDGRPVSLLDAAISAGAGGASGHFAGKFAENRVAKLPNNAKRIGFLPPSTGEMGERMMRFRTRLRGESAPQGPHRLPLNDLLSEEAIMAGHNGFGSRSTVPDEYITLGRAEAKFGDHPKFTPNQAEAYALDPDAVRIDNFRSRDIGALVGVPAAQLATIEARNEADIIDHRGGVIYRRAPHRSFFVLD